MKNPFLLLMLPLVMMHWLGCENKPNEAQLKYMQLVKDADSLRILHKALVNSHDEITNTHKALAGMLLSMEEIDSTILAEMSIHDSILDNHKRLLKEHEAIQIAHDDFRKKRENGDIIQVEVPGRLEQMVKDHEKMVTEHEMIAREHEQIRSDHQKYKEVFASADSTDKEDG